MTVDRVTGGTPAARDARAELKRLSQQLEAVFLNQLLQAMRASVSHESSDTGPGGEMFQAMLDEKLASEAAARETRGLADALYRQLARRLDANPGTRP